MITKALAFTRRQETAAPAADRPLMDRFDVATIIDIGCRPYQQDALVANYVNGEDVGIAVLADGMGGHLGGEVASSIASATAFASAKSGLIAARFDAVAIPSVLNDAVDRANAAIAAEAQSGPHLHGMGTTLVVTAMIGPDLYFASVGDSPLYRYRDGQLAQLNHSHSMAAQIDAMVVAGLIDEKDARNHPQRHELTSAVCGHEIARRHCPVAPVTMCAGDILVLASDGIQTLRDDAIREIISRNRKNSADEISKALLKAVLAAKDAEQDNVSILVIKVVSDAPAHIVRPPEKEPALVRSKPPSGDDGEFETASDLLNQALGL